MSATVSDGPMMGGAGFGAQRPGRGRGDGCLPKYECERGGSNPHGFPHWILSPAHPSRKDKEYQKIHNDAPAKVPTVVPSPTGAVSDPYFASDLARVVAAWD